jgi:CDP-diacylglycerol--glycerol-3-phosphate 3-phosphatidyltransferase
VNLPNQITIARLLLSIVLFVLLPMGHYAASVAVFLLAAGTDWLDGYIARKYNLVTKLGRILDPFVDKFLICGVFIYLAAIPQSGIAAWMAVVVVARELGVTVLRSFLEGEGVDFSAKMAGKLKMVFQCVAAVASLVVLDALARRGTAPDVLTWTLLASAWLAVGSTIYSGAGYVLRAVQLLNPKPTTD